MRYVDSSGQPFQAVSRDPATPGGEFITAGAFASDAMTISDRLTISAGIRFDHNRAISPDLPARDLAGQETDATVNGLGTLYTWNVWSPRLGVTTKLTSDGRTMLRASFGRFHQGVLTGELGPIHPGQTPITTMAFDPATGGYTRLVSVVDPKTNLFSIPTPGHRAQTSIPWEWTASSVARSRWRLRTSARRQRLHRLDRYRRDLSRGDAYACRRPRGAGARAHERHRQPTISAHESGRLLADL